MGNGEFQISNAIKEQWVEQLNSNTRTFSNKITSESFQLIVLSETKSELHISELIERSIYPIPKTPKIIILNDKQDKISILVQKQAIPIKGILSVVCLQLQLLQIIHKIVDIAWALYRRYGPFGITQKMIGGNSNSELILWINQSYQNCQIQLLPHKNSYPQQAMLSQILQIIRANCPLTLVHDLFVSPPSTFSSFITSITRMIEEERYSLSMQKLSINNRNIDPPYPLSPRNLIKNEKPFSISANDEKSKQKRRKNNIPNFIKMIKDKKQNPQKESKSKNTNYKKSDGFAEYQKSHHKNCKKQFGSNDSKNTISKVRSLNASPSTKIHPRANGNLSNATTNNSVISWNVSSKGVSDLLTASKKSAECASKYHAEREQSSFSRREIKLFNEFRNEESKASSGINIRTNKCKNQENLGEVTFQKEEDNSYSAYSRSRFSFGSLNSFCKHLSESQELTENKRQLKLEKMLKNDKQIDQSRGEDSYSVIIHDELHHSIYEDEQLAIKEEFSRILY